MGIEITAEEKLNLRYSLGFPEEFFQRIVDSEVAFKEAIVNIQNVIDFYMNKEELTNSMLLKVTFGYYTKYIYINYRDRHLYTINAIGHLKGFKEDIAFLIKDAPVEKDLNVEVVPFTETILIKYVMTLTEIYSGNGAGSHMLTRFFENTPENYAKYVERFKPVKVALVASSLKIQVSDNV